MIENQNIPSLRFQEYTAPLNTSTLKELGRFYYGKSAPKHSLSETAETPCVRYGELYTKFNGVIEEVYSYTEIPKSQLRFSKGDEILIPRVGEDPIGFSDCSWLKLKGIAIGEMISVYETGQIPLYVVLYIRSKLKYKFARMVEGGSVSNLYYKYLEDIKMNYPSLPEQQKIADFLTMVDKRIELIEMKKTLLETYKKGVMKKIFNQEIRFKDDNDNNFSDWEEKKLGEITNKKSSNISANSIEFNKGEYTIYGATGELKEVDFYEMDRPYISIVKDGSGVGRVKLCKPYSSVLGTLEILTNNKSSDLNFLFQFLSKTSFLKYVTGSSIPHIYYKDYSKLKLSVPSIKEQEKISKFASSIDSQIELLENQIDKSKTWKKGLLQKMFV